MVELTDQYVEITSSDGCGTQGELEVGSFEDDDVGAADELDGRDFDAVDTPFFGLDVHAVEVVSCAWGNREIELGAHGFGSVVEDAEGMDVSAVSGNGVVDDLAVVAGSKRFSYREHMYSFEKSALAVAVRAGKDY